MIIQSYILIWKNSAMDRSSTIAFVTQNYNIILSLDMSDILTWLMQIFPIRIYDHHNLDIYNAC